MDYPTYDVKFSEIIFTREGDDLVLTHEKEGGEIETLDSFSNYFTALTPDPYMIYANDDSGKQMPYVIKSSAQINVTVTTPQYTGTDYNENLTAVKATSSEDYYNGANTAGSYIGTGDAETREFVSMIDGAGGNDVIKGTDGDDWLDGGDGNDTIYGGTGIDMLKGNAGNDRIYAGSLQEDGTIEYNTSNTEIYGDAGDDTIYGGKGNDFIWAGEGADTIYLNGGSNTLVFNETDGKKDVIYNATGADTLRFVNDDGTNLSGYKFSDLIFTRLNDDKGALTDDLNITISSSNNVITIKDFFKGGKFSDNIDKIVAIDYDEEHNAYEKTYSIIDDALISVYNVTDYEGYNILYDEEHNIYKGYNENITGTDNDVKIYGNLGDDTIHGGKGKDYINGSEGDDVIYAGDDGKDVISGDIGDDTLHGSAANLKSVEFYGAAGDDTIYSGAGNDFIWSGEGDDTIYLNNGGKNTLVFSENNFGNDTIYSGCIDDTLKFALKYKDSEGTTITQGYHYDDLSFIPIENDDGELKDLKITATYIDEEEHETINSVLLKDYASSQINNVIAFDEDGNLATYSILDFIAVDRNLTPNTKGVITGTKYADIINGVANKNNTIKANGGNDIITANSGNDKIYAGEGINEIIFREGDGKDTIYSNNGSDTIIFEGFDNLDSFVMSESGKNLVIKYGSSDDKVTLSNFLKGNHSVKQLIVKNNAGEIIGGKDFTAKDSTIIDINMAVLNKKSFSGSKLAETIYGTTENNTIKGGGGNDIIYALNGKNKIYTQSQKNDFSRVYTGYGNDTLNAGKGVDTFIFTESNSKDTVIANTKGSIVLDISNLSNVTYKEVGKNLVITNNFTANETELTGEITIKNYLNGKLTNNVNITEDGTYVCNLREYLATLQSIDNKTITIGNKDSDKKQKITGTFLDEMIYGGINNDTIKSGTGKDDIEGRNGNDKLYGYIAKVDKKYKYIDNKNSKNFIFNYDVSGSTALGDGKDTIYNSKNSDRIIFNVDSISDALALLDNMEFSSNKNNLTISYIKDANNKVTDSITISNYYKLDSENEALRYVDIVYGTQQVELDLTNRNIDDLKEEVASWTVLNSAHNSGMPELVYNQPNELSSMILYS